MTGLCVLSLHDWDVSPARAREIQQELRSGVSRSNEVGQVHSVAGVDVGFRAETARAAVAVLTFPELYQIEVRIAQRRVEFPYVPGLLSFREAPAILDAFQSVENKPDLILVDGQGIAHPRRLGIASHIGILLDTPTIGCAKSLLCGSHGPVEESVGSYSPVMDKGEVVGAALRTKVGVKPVYVSIGHKVDLETAMDLVLACSKGYRLPEPTRLAHLAASKPERLL